MATAATTTAATATAGTDNNNEDGPADESDDSSSPTLSPVAGPLETMPNEFHSALDEFRNNWQRELQQTQSNETSGDAAGTAAVAAATAAVSAAATGVVHDVGEYDDNAASAQYKQQQTQAESLFRKAVELEQRGKVYDALPLYRKAVQLVPDIEFKYYEHQKLKVNPEMTITHNVAPANGENGDGGVGAADGEANSDGVDELFDEHDLYEKFRFDLASEYGGKLLLSSHQRDTGMVITTERHISDLPAELILYILRWVVSSQLDMRSLEQCACVSKGMYLCARDEELWRLACMKVWGYNLGTLDPTVYSSWRQMFLNRERVLFNGCYISKTTYLRMGEQSFQDQFYRPVQLVEYFRYARFLPDGQVLMMTTADEPAQGVGKLRNLQQLRPDILRGKYHLFGNTISIVLKKQNKQASQQHQHQQQQRYARHRRGSSATAFDDASTSYCIEFQIVSTAKRKCVQLVWVHYSIEVKRNKVVTSTEFELLPSKYPPLWFSPVRSYHQDSDAPLG